MEGKGTDHIVAQPSDSWKLNAMSTWVEGSVQTMSVSAGFVSTHSCDPGRDGDVGGRDMPCCFWKPSPVCILVLQQHSAGLFLGFDGDASHFLLVLAILGLYLRGTRASQLQWSDSRWERSAMAKVWAWCTRHRLAMVARRRWTEAVKQTDLDVLGRTEAGASVEPVVIAEFVDLDTSPVGLLSRMRHCLRHHRLVGVPSVGRDAVVVRKEVGRNVEVLLEREFGLGVRRVAEDGERRHFVERWARDNGCARGGVVVGQPVLVTGTERLSRRLFEWARRAWRRSWRLAVLKQVELWRQVDKQCSVT